MKNGVFQFQRMSSSVESAFCRARKSAMRFFCAGVSGAVESGRSTRIESSHCVYRGRHCGFWSAVRSPVATLMRDMFPPCDSA